MELVAQFLLIKYNFCFLLTIYMYNNEYDKQRIMNEIALLQEKLNEEQNKNYQERDKEKELKLIYKQFITGLKLSTGNNFF